MNNYGKRDRKKQILRSGGVAGFFNSGESACKTS